MASITLEPIRWQTSPSRVAICDNGDRPQVRYQVTAPRQFEAICIGRPVEELPRILTLFGPAHHLAAAAALDHLFNVEPPPLAVNMRAALLKTLYYVHHLRQLYALVSFGQNPFQDFRSAQRQRQSWDSHRLMDDIMYHVALGQESAAILGGRSDHPLAAVAGGISRYIKDVSFARLGEIGRSCLQFALGLADRLRPLLFSEGSFLRDLQSIRGKAMGYLCLSDSPDSGEAAAVCVGNAAAEEIDRFSAEQIADKIGLQREAWTYEPFIFLKEKGWKGLDSDGLFFVGPLARLNRGQPLQTELAERERRQMIETLGAFRHFGPVSAFWALIVEVIQAAEQMVHLYRKENLLGPAPRTIPSQIGATGCGILEAPDGLMVHHYRVNSKGIVEELQILDAASANNALRCLITQHVVEACRLEGRPWKETKDRIEISLLPF